MASGRTITFTPETDMTDFYNYKPEHIARDLCIDIGRVHPLARRVVVDLIDERDVDMRIAVLPDEVDLCVYRARATQHIRGCETGDVMVWTIGFPYGGGWSYLIRGGIDLLDVMQWALCCVIDLRATKHPDQVRPCMRYACGTYRLLPRA